MRHNFCSARFWASRFVSVRTSVYSCVCSAYASSCAYSAVHLHALVRAPVSVLGKLQSLTNNTHVLMHVILSTTTVSSIYVPCDGTGSTAK
jgi:hypothetical protein